MIFDKHANLKYKYFGIWDIMVKWEENKRMYKKLIRRKLDKRLNNIKGVCIPVYR